MFWKNYSELCKRQGTTPSEVLAKNKISAGCVTKWKNGTIPNQKTLEKLATHFGVTKEYFFIDHENVKNNYTFISYQNKKDKSLFDAMSDSLKAMTADQAERTQIAANAMEQTLLDAFRASTDAGRMAILEAALKAKMANDGSDVAQKKKS